MQASNTTRMGYLLHGGQTVQLQNLMRNNSVLNLNTPHMKYLALRYIVGIGNMQYRIGHLFSKGSLQEQKNFTQIK